MVAKAWKRSSAREDRRLTEDRRSLLERYMIDAEQAQARVERAAEQQPRRAAKRAAEEQAMQLAAGEEAKRAAEEAKRPTAEEQARRAAEAATRAAWVHAAQAVHAAAEQAKRLTRALADLPVAGRPVSAPRPSMLSVAAPPAAHDAPDAAEIAEPRGRAEAEPEPDGRLPIYRWQDPPAKFEDAPERIDS